VALANFPSFLYISVNMAFVKPNSYVVNPSDISELLFQRLEVLRAADDIALSYDCKINNNNNNNSNGNENEDNAIKYVGPISIQRPHAASTKGRSLVATRSLDAGELLFVTSPIVKCNVQRVWHEWSTQNRNHKDTERNNDSAVPVPVVSLAEVSEQVLLMACKDAIANKKYGLVNCLQALERSQTRDASDTSKPTCIPTLLGQTNDDDVWESNTRTTDPIPLSDEEIVQIIRRNAFGADFPTMNRIEQRWLDAYALENNNDRGNNSTGSSDTNNNKANVDDILPSRLLGIYGLAAMINHSCIPNAVRVFAGEIMIVHTCQPVKKDEEIVWSYIPLIQNYTQRQAQLQQTHNFTCYCIRCRSESIFLSSIDPNIHAQLQKIQSRGCSIAMQDVQIAINELENDTLNQSHPILTNEMKRYIRLSNVQLYMDYFNHSLSTILEKSVTELQHLFQLHLAFVACHNVSTEHLSVRGSDCKKHYYQALTSSKLSLTSFLN
jgi:SET domain